MSTRTLGFGRQAGVGGRAGRVARRSLLAIAALAGALVLPAVAQANKVSIRGSMEGAIHIANGDKVAAGYSFSISGAHPGMTVKMVGAQVTFSGNCSNGGTGSLTI